MLPDIKSKFDMCLNHFHDVKTFTFSYNVMGSFEAQGGLKKKIKYFTLHFPINFPYLAFILWHVGFAHTNLYFFLREAEMEKN